MNIACNQLFWLPGINYPTFLLKEKQFLCHLKKYASEKLKRYFIFKATSTSWSSRNQSPLLCGPNPDLKWIERFSTWDFLSSPTFDSGRLEPEFQNLHLENFICRTQSNWTKIIKSSQFNSKGNKRCGVDLSFVLTKWMNIQHILARSCKGQYLFIALSLKAKLPT